MKYLLILTVMLITWRCDPPKETDVEEISLDSIQSIENFPEGAWVHPQALRVIPYDTWVHSTKDSIAVKGFAFMSQDRYPNDSTGNYESIVTDEMLLAWLRDSIGGTQTLTWSDDTLTISGGNSVVITGFADSTLTSDSLAAHLVRIVALEADSHTAVTLTGSPDYITLSGQQITRGLIDLTTDVTGVLPQSNFDTTGLTGGGSGGGSSVWTLTVDTVSISKTRLRMGGTKFPTKNAFFNIADRVLMMNSGFNGQANYFFGDYASWSTIHGGAGYNEANNFHYWGNTNDITKPLRAEIESNASAMQFYIEGKGEAWYGWQDTSAHKWSFGYDTDIGGTKLLWSPSFGLGSHVASLSTTGLFFADRLYLGNESGTYILDVDNDAEVVNAKLGTMPAGFQVMPTNFKRTLIVDNLEDAYLQIAAPDPGSVSSGIMITSIESADSNHTWSINNRGKSTEYDLDFIYTTTTASLTDNPIVGGVGNRSVLTLEQKGEVGINNQSPSEALDVVGNVKVSGRITLGAVYIVTGTGDPEGSVTAPKGSIFLRTDGGSGTTLYSKESGAGNTGWAAN